MQGRPTCHSAVPSDDKEPTQMSKNRARVYKKSSSSVFYLTPMSSLTERYFKSHFLVGSSFRWSGVVHRPLLIYYLQEKFISQYLLLIGGGVNVLTLSDNSEEQSVELMEREKREKIFNVMGFISAAIFIVVFVLAKWQS